MAVLLVVLVVLLSSAPAAVAALPRLTVERGDDAAIVDEGGRQVLLRGINVNQLGDYYAWDPVRPTVIPLRESDFAGIARLGFDVVRLVLNWSALEPNRGRIDETYLARIRQALGWAKSHDLYVVLDMHQDSWGKFIATPPGSACPPGLGPAVGWDGAPRWATFTDGMTTCRAAETRELSPAVAHAFQHFYLDHDGIQQHLVQVWRRLAREFGGDTAIAGYDLLNEPHPGWVVGADQSLALGRYYARAIAAIRAGERDAPGGFPHVVFFEPSVVWSGFGVDSLPPPGFTTDERIVFAPHLYAESITVDQKLGLSTVSVEQGWEAARRAASLYDAPLWSGEWAWFGPPERDLPKVERYLREEDAHRAGGAWWVWKQACGDPHIAGEPTLARSLNPMACPGDRPLGQAAAYARLLSRPYPRFAPGRLALIDADAASGRFRVAGRDGEAGGSCRLEVWVPDRGRDEPQLSGTGVGSLTVRKVAGGWIAGACARGSYELRGAPGAAATARGRCRSRRVVTLRVPARLNRVRVHVAGARARMIRVRRRSVVVDLRGARRARVVIRITARRSDGRRYAQRRVVRTCAKRRAS